jgi:lysophospholipase L1-like esterase
LTLPKGGLPETKLLLLGVFPRAEARPKDADKVAAAGLRKKTQDVNKIIARLDDGKRVKYLDIGPKFLDADGALTKEIMPDYLHLSPKGYQIWADSVLPTLTEMLGGDRKD